MTAPPEHGERGGRLRSTSVATAERKGGRGPHHTDRVGVLCSHTVSVPNAVPATWGSLELVSFIHIYSYIYIFFYRYILNILRQWGPGCSRRALYPCYRHTDRDGEGHTDEAREMREKDTEALADPQASECRLTSALVGSGANVPSRRTGPGWGHSVKSDRRIHRKDSYDFESPKGR